MFICFGVLRCNTEGAKGNNVSKSLLQIKMEVTEDETLCDAPLFTSVLGSLTDC